METILEYGHNGQKIFTYLRWMYSFPSGSKIMATLYVKKKQIKISEGIHKYLNTIMLF